MVEKASLLLDDADAQCTEGNFDEAKKTLAAVTKLVTAPDQ
jgi:soluble cytochrome b562